MKKVKHVWIQEEDTPQYGKSNLLRVNLSF